MEAEEQKLLHCHVVNTMVAEKMNGKILNFKKLNCVQILLKQNFADKNKRIDKNMKA